MPIFPRNTSRIIRAIAQLRSLASLSISTMNLGDHSSYLARTEHQQLLSKQQNFSEIQKQHFFVNAASFEFDWDKGAIYIKNIDEVKNRYQKLYSRNSEEFDEIKNEILSIFNQKLTENFDLEKLNEIKIIKAEEQDKSRPNRLFSYAENRITQMILAKMKFENSKNEKFLEKYANYFVIELIKNSVFEKLIDELGFNSSEVYRRLEPYFSKTNATAFFARDDNVFINGKIYHVDEKITQRLLSDENISYAGVTQIVGGSDIAATLKDKKIHTLPFMLEGGNAVFDPQKRKLFICISNLFFDGYYNKFKRGFAVAPDGDVFEYSSYDGYCEFINNWARANDVDLEIIHRDLRHSNYVSELYHLDTFFNVVNGAVLVCKWAIKDENYQKLVEIYGQDKILDLTREEWRGLATNFAKINENNVIFTSNNVSDRVIKFLQDNDVSCALPSISLGFKRNDGVRCRTFEIAENEMSKTTKKSNPNNAKAAEMALKLSKQLMPNGLRNSRIMHELARIAENGKELKNLEKPNTRAESAQASDLQDSKHQLD